MRSTRLMHAAGGFHLPVVDRRFKRGVDSNAADSGGETAVMFSARGSHVQPVDRLLERGAEPSAVDKESEKALMVAAEVSYLQEITIGCCRCSSLGDVTNCVGFVSLGWGWGAMTRKF